MKILIVDDEPRHLRGMSAMIQAMRPHAQVSVAKDGEVALASIRSELPDIILSDIQMPNLDGLALLKALEAEGIRTKVVMVSAFNLFDYAQTALRHGATDYLLKPVDADKVEALLQRMEGLITEEARERGESADLKQRLRLTSPAYRSRLLHQWLSGNLTLDEGKKLDEWAMLQEVNILILTEIGTGGSCAGDSALLSQSLTDRLCQLGAVFGEACVFPLHSLPNQGSRFVTAIKLSTPAQLPKLLPEVRVRLQAISASGQTWGSLRHGIGCRALEERDGVGIPELYQRAQMALAHTFHEEWQGVTSSLELVPTMTEAFNLNGEELFEALQGPTVDAAEAMCRAAFRELACGGNTDPKLIKNYASLMLMKIKSRTKDIVDRQVGNMITETVVSQIPVCSSSEELVALLLLRLNELHRSLALRKQDRHELIVEEFLGWIAEHFRDDLTLEMAAERFHFNASYFSTLIKSRTGRSFSDHLTEARMRRAKELLGTGQHKIYEIAEQCGYRDTKYFTRMFKKQFGLSPEAYKRIPAATAGSEEPS
ncbi:two-component system, response regulator YesN [Paenibacillus sp. UNCCL117]|uniref:response regulator transcription factor n=1 Tax=unclassified Paenibacillus TaxID=185978 RepID=UPI000880C3D4|nr:MULTISPECIES: response regulator [unclassified Paenibacillus]SDD33246.1 two-component system, response regulator YesN [Paenibacillus sp. cl123]SFW39620.1 two-component system, response regulator YesN [Paenibacillus sp. UNCCL117]